MAFWCDGGTINLTAFGLGLPELEFDEMNAVEIVGNGRMALEHGNDVLRLGIAPEFDGVDAQEPDANGDEMAGRDIERVAK